MCCFLRQVNAGQLQAIFRGGFNPLAGQALHPIPHNDCVVDGVGVDGNPSCKMWGWYWDGNDTSLFSFWWLVYLRARVHAFCKCILSLVYSVSLFAVAPPHSTL